MAAELLNKLRQRREHVDSGGEHFASVPTPHEADATEVESTPSISPFASPEVKIKKFSTMHKAQAPPGTFGWCSSPGGADFKSAINRRRATVDGHGETYESNPSQMTADCGHRGQDGGTPPDASPREPAETQQDTLVGEQRQRRQSRNFRAALDEQRAAVDGLGLIFENVPEARLNGCSERATKEPATKEMALGSLPSPSRACGGAHAGAHVSPAAAATFKAEGGAAPGASRKEPPASVPEDAAAEEEPALEEAESELLAHEPAAGVQEEEADSEPAAHEPAAGAQDEELDGETSPVEVAAASAAEFADDFLEGPAPLCEDIDEGADEDATKQRNDSFSEVLDEDEGETVEGPPVQVEGNKAKWLIPLRRYGRQMWCVQSPSFSIGPLGSVQLELHTRGARKGQLTLRSSQRSPPGLKVKLFLGQGWAKKNMREMRANEEISEQFDTDRLAGRESVLCGLVVEAK